MTYDCGHGYVSLSCKFDCDYVPIVPGSWCTCSAGSVFAVIYRVSTIIFVVLLVGGLLDAGCVGMYAW